MLVLQYGRTALHFSAARSQIDAVKLLLEHSADVDVDAQDKEGTTALMMAAKRGHISVACVLVQSGADFDLLDRFGRNALSYLWKEEHKQQLQGEMDARCSNPTLK